MVWELGNQWVGSGGRKRVMGSGYYRKTLYTCMKIAQWNLPEAVKMLAEEGI
jgi:hypothetical protein